MGVNQLLEKNSYVPTYESWYDTKMADKMEKAGVGEGDMQQEVADSTQELVGPAAAALAASEPGESGKRTSTNTPKLHRHGSTRSVVSSTPESDLKRPRGGSCESLAVPSESPALSVESATSAASMEKSSTAKDEGVLW